MNSLKSLRQYQFYLISLGGKLSNTLPESGLDVFPDAAMAAANPEVSASQLECPPISLVIFI